MYRPTAPALIALSLAMIPSIASIPSPSIHAHPIYNSRADIDRIQSTHADIARIQIDAISSITIGDVASIDIERPIGRIDIQIIPSIEHPVA